MKKKTDIWLTSGEQFYFIFQTIYYALKRLDDTEIIVPWKSKGLSAKIFTIITATDNSITPLIKDKYLFCLVFKESCLKQKNATYNPLNRIIFLLFMN